MAVEIPRGSCRLETPVETDVGRKGWFNDFLGNKMQSLRRNIQIKRSSAYKNPSYITNSQIIIEMYVQNNRLKSKSKKKNKSI